MMRFFKVLLLTIFLAACSEGVEDRSIMVKTDDPTMLAARADAQASLSSFLEKAANPAPGTENYAVKVKIQDEYGVEHFWVTPFLETPTGFKGMISNDPAVVRKVRAGQSYEFTREDVSDWMYMKDGKIHGGYSIRALLPSLPKKEADQYRAMLAEL